MKQNNKTVLKELLVCSNPIEQRGSFNQIYFFKIFLAICICYYHAVWFLNKIYDKTTLPLWNDGRENASMAVDCFFIMSGFLLMNRHDLNIWEFIKKRLIRLLPAFYICVIFSWLSSLLGANVQFVLKENQTFYSLAANLLLLNFELKNILLLVSWFIYPLFWVSLGYEVLTRLTGKYVVMCSAIFLTLLAYVIVGQHGIYVRKFLYGFSIGFYRGLGGIGLGILIYYLFNFFAPLLQKIRSHLFINTLLFFIQLSVITFLGYLFFFASDTNVFFVILPFCLSFFICLLKNPLLDKVLGNSFFKILSQLSYMLFLSHATVFGITQTILRHYHFIPQTPLLYFCILMYNALIIAAVFHYFIEAPLIKLLKKKILRKCY